MRLCFYIFIGFISSISVNAQFINTVGGIPGKGGNSGNGGPLSAALFSYPYAIVTDHSGQLYIGDLHNRVIRKVNSAGILSIFAGTGKGDYSGDGGPAINAEINSPVDFFIDNRGVFYFSDIGNEVIRSIDPSGIIRTIAGNGSIGNGMPFIGDGGPATSVSLYDAQAIAVDNDGNVFIVETAKNTIRKVNPQGIISTVCGQGIDGRGYSGDGGAASIAALNAPTDIAIDPAGNIIIADLGNHVLRLIDRTGLIRTIAGDGTAGYSGDGGPALAARLHRPFGVAIDASGAIYVAEEGNHVIRKISPDGIISTVAGTGSEGYSGDGGPAIAARLSYPKRIAIDQSGNIYITDPGNNTIRKIGVCALATSLTVVAPPTAVCRGETLVLTAQSVNSGATPSFQWTVNGENVGNNSPVFSSNALLDGDLVKCTMTGNFPCAGSVVSSNPFSVQITAPPVIQLPSGVTIVGGSSLQLAPVVSGGAVGFSWTPSTGLSNPSIFNPVATPADNTLYQLKATNSQGCESFSSILVKIYQEFFVPTAFTPNGDGKNDVFVIPSGGSFELERFSIYDRWGNHVFTSMDMTKGWDGTYKGLPAPAGVYAVLITGKNMEQPLLFKGTVTLIR